MHAAGRGKTSEGCTPALVGAPVPAAVHGWPQTSVSYHGRLSFPHENSGHVMPGGSVHGLCQTDCTGCDGMHAAAGVQQSAAFPYACCPCMVPCPALAAAAVCCRPTVEPWLHGLRRRLLVAYGATAVLGRDMSGHVRCRTVAVQDCSNNQWQLRVLHRHMVWVGDTMRLMLFL